MQCVLEYVQMSKKAKRLFEQFQPQHYDLSLSFDKKARSFSGSVTISGNKVGRPSQRITFHQRDLHINSAKVIKNDKSGEIVLDIERINTQKKLDEVRLHCSQMVYPGNYTVTIEFSGALTDDMLGIYPCYFENKGKKDFLIATQFESHYARDAFPCIDEPEAKATFQLTLKTPKGDRVLSNTMPEKTTDEGNQTTTIFNKTPRMSTYLLAFVFGNMHSVESKTKDGTIVRSWSSIAQPKKFLQYSLDEAVKVLDFFSEYFNVEYPLEKCDQVALPDFDSGAMENWGLITYREIALLSDPDNPSISSEQYTSLVVAHELSHQWFGNLVTMKWWDDLWLNESFASIMEHLALDRLHPDWQQWEIFTSSDVISATSRDIYSGVQPVGVQVTDPELIDTLFDPAIVYAKGARLLKMLRDYIGDEDFRRGLSTYFKSLAYKNATREDLWQHLSKSSGKDISDLMTPWLTQSGVPLISVTKKSKDCLQVSQQRFVLDKKTDDSLWPVPLLADVDISPQILSSKAADINTDSDFVRLNCSASGHYLVQYDKSLQEKLFTAFADGDIPPPARIDVVNTLYLLARRGDNSLVDAINLVIRAKAETRDSVWSQMLRIVGAAKQLTEGDDEEVEGNLNDLKRSLAQSQYEQLGWEDKAKDDPNTKQLRHTMIALMIGGESKEAINEALTRYKKTRAVQDLPAETRNTILGAAVRFGDKNVIPELVKTYSDVAPDVQLDITSALSSTKNAKQANRILAQALGPKGFVRPQDVMRWLAMFLRNYHTRDVAWEWIVANWDWVEKTFSKSKSFDYLPTYCSSVISTKPDQKRYSDFFEPKKDIKSLKRNIEVGLSDIAARVAWRKRDEDKIKSWLKSQAKN